MEPLTNHPQDRNDARGCSERQERKHPRIALHRKVALCGLVLVAGCFAANSSVPNPTPEQPILTDGAKAFELLKAQVAFGPRYPGSEGHRKCLEWIVAESKKYTDKVVKQEFSHKWSANGFDVKMTNVIATMDFGAKKTVLLLAHWDTRPTADQEWESRDAQKPVLGANDGASGVAVLLDLMRAFKETPPPVNVIFLFTDGEDLGPGLDEMFLGAAHYAKNLPTPKPNYGILLDMIGDNDLRIPVEPNSLDAAPDLVKRFYANAKAIGLGATFPTEQQGSIYDDHLPLIAAGVPTMDLIDFSYPHWHTLADTVDKCSAESLGKVGKAVESFLRKE
ncbi:MAG: M28 family peptidase [Armatimonadota bacterium]|nr:M28 family peptidase [Armatimonadota bacterium]